MLFKRVIPVIVLILLLAFTIFTIREMQLGSFDVSSPPENISRYGLYMRNLLESLQQKVDARVHNAISGEQTENEVRGQ